MSEHVYVVRMGTTRGEGAYVTRYDGDDWSASTRQRDAYRWDAHDKPYAELATIALGAARVVRIVPRSAKAPETKKGTER